jgi:hypothetical protein
MKHARWTIPMVIVLIAVMAVTMGVACGKANLDPTITSLSADPATIIAGYTSSISCVASDPDADTLSYAWICSGGDISGTGSTVTYTTLDVAGSYTIGVTVSDGNGGSVDESITVAVIVNNAPVISGVTATPTMVVGGGSSDVMCDASDPDLDTLSYSWSSTGGSISGSGNAVIWTAPAADGNYSITAAVSDGKGGTDSQSVTVTVSTNHAPVISSVTPSPATVYANGSSAVTCSATDADSDTLNYEWIASGGSISGSGNVITWTAPAEEGGYAVTATVSDGKGGTATLGAAIVVEAAPVNHAPVITDLTSSPISVAPSASASINCFATDDDSDPLSYTWNASAGTVSGSGGGITWQAPATEGSCTINVVVDDGNGGTDTRSLIISVAASTGSLSISSTPSGASIMIDGINTGSITPCTIAGLTPGSHTVKLSKTYYKNKSGSAIVVADSTAGVNWALTAAPSQTVTLQPGATGKDSYVIHSVPSTTHGTYTSLYAGANAVGAESRTYLEFSLGLPSTANITSARLGLWYAGTGSATVASIGAYRVTSVWNESTITWNNKPTYYSSAYSWLSLPAAVTNNYVEWDMKYMVSYWVKGLYPNRGVMLMDTNEATAETWKGFYSSDWSNSSQRPYLEITYWDPGS